MRYVATVVVLRIVISIVLAVLARYLRVIGRRGELSVFVRIGIAFVVRDLIALAAPERTVFLDAIAIGVAYLMFIGWTGSFRRSNRSFRAAVIASFGALILILIDLMLPGIQRFGLPTAVVVIPIVMHLLAFVAVTRIDRYTSFRGNELEPLRPALQTIFGSLLIVRSIAPFGPDSFAATIGVFDVSPFLIAVMYLFARHVGDMREKSRSLRRNAQSIFAFLSGVGSSLDESETPDAILTSAIRTMVDASDADAGVAVVADDTGNRVVAVEGLFPPPIAVPEIVKTKAGALARFLYSMRIDADTPVWGEALRTGQARFIARASGDVHYSRHAEDRVFHLNSVAILPLRVRGNVLGLLSVVRNKHGKEFSHSDFQHGRTMADFVAVTLDNYYSYLRMIAGQRIQRDVEIAAEIQNRLHATGVVEWNGVESVGLSHPARGIGGDYYDVIPLDSGRTAVVICDVSGKGVPAALVMVMVRTIVRLVLQHTDEAGSVLNRINEGLADSIEMDRFATAAVAIVDPKRKRISYANAGHHPALFVSRHGSTDRCGSGTTKDHPACEIDAEGLPVGIERESEYESISVPFDEGDVILFYTDGAIEALNETGEEYGVRRLAETLTRAVQTPSWREERRSAAAPPGSEPTTGEGGMRRANEILSAVDEDIHEFVGDRERHDDITLLVCAATASHPLENGE